MRIIFVLFLLFPAISSASPSAKEVKNSLCDGVMVKCFIGGR